MSVFDALEQPADRADHAKRKGCFLQPDDLEAGQLICVHSCTDGDRVAGEGMALKVLAVQLPFVVVKPLGNPCWQPCTFNVADYRLMRVSEEFARAQQEVEPPRNARRWWR